MRKVTHEFTPEEQMELLHNPYTRTVSESASFIMHDSV